MASRAEISPRSIRRRMCSSTSSARGMLRPTRWRRMRSSVAGLAAGSREVMGHPAGWRAGGRWRRRWPASGVSTVLPRGWRRLGLLPGRRAVGWRRLGAVARGDPALAAPLLRRMGGDQRAVFQDVDRAGGNLHLDGPPAGAVGHGVEIAGDRDHAVAGDAALQRQHGVEGTGRQRLEVTAAPRRSARRRPAGWWRAGGRWRPGPATGRTGRSDRRDCGRCGRGRSPRAHSGRAAPPCPWSWPGRACRPSAGSRNGRPGPGAWHCRRCPCRLVGILDLAEHGGLHAVVQDLLGHAAQGLEGGDVAAEHGRQILAGDEAGPHHAAVAEHEREQPDDPLDLGLVGEHGLEEGEIHLGLLAGRGLEPALELNLGLGPDRAQEILQHRIAALVAERADLPEQAPAAEFREASGDALAGKAQRGPTRVCRGGRGV